MFTERSRRSVVAGALVFDEGQAGDCAYIIESGEIGLSCRMGDDWVQLAVAGPGELIGEMALIDNGLRSARGTALVDSNLLVISKAYLERLLDDTDPTVEMLLQVVLERFREMRGRLLEVSGGGMIIPSYSPSSGTTLKQQAQQTAQRLAAEERLAAALHNQELTLFYQPILDLGTGKMAGCEALIRWIDPERGLIPPVDFIPIAEKSGLIEPIGYWIFEEALRALHFFRSVVQAPLDKFFISVNLSSRQIQTVDQIEKLKGELDKLGDDRANIKIEITESVLMSNPMKVEELLTECSRSGMQIALDDFGTGYSSLSYLHRFPISNIKIDQSFVRTMGENSTSEKIVRSVCDLAHSLGMTTIAEGIETVDAQTMLKSFNGDYGQGYLYSKPVPKEEFVVFVAKAFPFSSLSSQIEID